MAAAVDETPAVEIPTPIGGLTIPEVAPGVPTPEEVPELLLAMGIVGVTSSLVSAFGTLISTMLTAPINFMIMRVALSPLLKSLVPPSA